MVRRWIILTSVVVAALPRCSSPHGGMVYFDSSITTDSHNVPLDSNQYYFPEELFPEVIEHYIFEDSTFNSQYRMEREIKKGSVDTFVLEWYSKHLFAMREPLLFNRSMDKEVYRFTWLRSFHHPIMVRIEKEGESHFLYWKELNGAGGYEPGSIIMDNQKSISPKEWQEFISKLEDIEFWEVPIGKSNHGEDGAEWILEGSTPDRYHVVTMCDYPCMYLLKLTGMNIPESEIY